MITNVNCPPKETVQKTLALTPARAPALAGGATGSSEFVGQPTRPREGRKRERRRLPVRGRSWPGPLRRPRGPCTVGARPPRSPGPGPAKRGAEARAAPAGGPSVSPPPLQTGLCSLEDVSFLSRTLPSTLRPKSSPTSSREDRSPCRGVHSDDHRAPRRATGRQQARPSGAQLPPASGPASKAQGRRRPPRPPPTARGTSGLSGGVGPRRSRRSPAPVRDHSFQRAARDAPRVSLEPASRVPSDRAGPGPRRPCRATDRPMSWATPSFHLVLHLSSARAEDMVAVFVFVVFVF